MVHEALQQWRRTHFNRGPIGDPAIARFLANVIASREGTPKDPRTMDSPFSLASLSPLSPLVVLTTTDTEDILLEPDSCLAAEFAELVDGEIPLEIQEIEIEQEIEIDSNQEYRTSSSEDDISSIFEKVEENEEKNKTTEDKEWTERPRRSTRTKTKRMNNAANTPRVSRSRSSTRTMKRSTAPKTVKKKKQTVDEIFEVLPQGESRKCSCKKSKCLKLYCECFAAGVLCDGGCRCSDCSNTADNVATRRKAVAYKLSRKPRAFQEKIVEATGAKDGAVHSKGCNCKRSGCQKKYCECYQGGVACNDSCKCVGCKNDGSLMHLRDLGVAGWKAPDGGFKQSAHGIMSTMIVVPEGGVIEEPIEVAPIELALEQFLLTEHAKREELRKLSLTQTPQMMEAEEVEASTSNSTTVWPVAKLAQVTPRSGTTLEPYPENSKRRCQKKTPKSFSNPKNSRESDSDGWLVELNGDSLMSSDSIMSSVQEECGREALPKGIKFRAQWSDGENPGYFHNDDGKLCWGMGITEGIADGLDAADILEDVFVDSVDVDTNMEDLTEGTKDDIVFGDVVSHTEDILLGTVHTNKPEVEDEVMREMEGAMADLLTPRFMEVVTPRLSELLTPRSCRSNGTTRSSNMDAEFDWDQHISTPRGNWDNVVSTPRAIAAC